MVTQFNTLDASDR